ncbi:hypothetical protein ACHHYP_02447 [Achlya hypogyna]|uniref:WRKY19-like zinc finger domain-containing protein n=1 Tax=Achlya hypogyna TaxID=1202772 RepID=A0A1V9Z6A3_ACHHY|nr:hypothetical protein ACHHYP_02447 [Achlya hypogyna]
MHSLTLELLEPIPFSIYNSPLLEVADLQMLVECHLDLADDVTDEEDSRLSSASSSTDVDDIGDDGRRKLCASPGCHSHVRSKGFCKRHGGGKECGVPSCTKEAQNGRFCIGHGGGKCCKVATCSNAAQSQGLCKAHGGGSRCKYLGCERSSQGGGFCRTHGGGKRCDVPGCTKGAQRGTKCAKHGGCRTCTMPGCARTDRGGGLCEIHRKDKTCVISGCKRLGKTLGMCTPHKRLEQGMTPILSHLDPIPFTANARALDEADCPFVAEYLQVLFTAPASEPAIKEEFDFRPSNASSHATDVETDDFPPLRRRICRFDGCSSHASASDMAEESSAVSKHVTKRLKTATSVSVMVAANAAKSTDAQTLLSLKGGVKLTEVAHDASLPAVVGAAKVVVIAEATAVANVATYKAAPRELSVAPSAPNMAGAALVALMAAREQIVVVVFAIFIAETRYASSLTAKDSERLWSIDPIPFCPSNQYSLPYFVIDEDVFHLFTDDTPLIKMEELTGAFLFDSPNVDPFAFTTSSSPQSPSLWTEPAPRTPAQSMAYRKPCSVEGCHRVVRSRGFCKRHGGGKQCIVEGCTKEAQNGEYCVGHGGGKSCKIDSCTNAAQSQGLCKAHGGGARCKFTGCDKCSQGGGYCRSHGGGKRCLEPGCTKGAQRGNKCAKHGGCRTCTVEDCVRTDRGGGLCEIHRKDKMCSIAGCKRLGKTMGMCTPHVREYRSAA